VIKLGASFRANTASMESTTIDEETGEEKKRMINRMRWKGYGPASIMFSDEHVRKKIVFFIYFLLIFDLFRYPQNLLLLLRKEEVRLTSAC
jgi:hypothetical protein